MDPLMIQWWNTPLYERPVFISQRVRFLDFKPCFGVSPTLAA
ncbi:MAG TPA: hypothetical protein VH349_18295 [Ktedonobacterales bacterium]|jgi:hypothetical protein